RDDLVTGVQTCALPILGITPVRSILHWAAHERLPQKLYLFYSNRDLEDTAFLEELEGLAAQNRCFTLIPTLTRLKSPGWPYENEIGRASCRVSYCRESQ